MPQELPKIKSFLLPVQKHTIDTAEIETENKVHKLPADLVQKYQDFYNAYATRDHESLKKQYDLIRAEIVDARKEKERIEIKITNISEQIGNQRKELNKVNKNYMSLLDQYEEDCNISEIVDHFIETENDESVDILANFVKLMAGYGVDVDAIYNKNSNQRLVTREYTKIVKNRDKLSDKEDLKKKIVSTLRNDLKFYQEKQTIQIDWLEILKEMKEVLRLELHDVSQEVLKTASTLAINTQFAEKIVNNVTNFEDWKRKTLKLNLSDKQLIAAKEEITKFVDSGETSYGVDQGLRNLVFENISSYIIPEEKHDEILIDTMHDDGCINHSD